MPEVSQAGDAKARVGNPAGDDAGKVAQLRIDVERNAMQAHPALEADTDGGDLVFVTDAALRPRDPDADAILAPLGAHIERRQRSNQPLLQCRNEAAHI